MPYAIGGGNNTAVVSAYSIGYWPTVYQVCPDRLLTECGQTATPYALVGACLPPPAFDVDARSFLKNSANTGCTDILASNYDLSATCDDGSCLTAYGCM